MKAFVILALAVGVLGTSCDSASPLGGIANAYRVTITEVENSCGDGPMIGARLIVGVDEGETSTDFTVGAGLSNPLMVPDVPVDDAGNFSVIVPIHYEGSSEYSEATLDFFGNISSYYLRATYSLRLLYYEGGPGSVYDACWITVTVDGGPCGDCPPLDNNGAM